MNSITKFGCKLISNKNGMQIYQGLSKNGTTITAAYKNGKPHKLIGQKLTTASNGAKEMMTKVKNFETGNSTILNNYITPNHLQKISVSQTVDGTGNLLLKRDINCYRTGAIANNGKPCDYVNSYLTKYNPANQNQNITYGQIIDRTKLNPAARPKPEGTVLSNGFEGIDPGRYSNYSLYTTAKHIDQTTGVKLNKLGYVS